MFVQFIQGQVSDADALARQLDRWNRELAPDAPGWLGNTGGVADDGTGFVAARFASPDDAARNADRDEQDAWWQATEACFAGPVAFVDCDDVQLLQGGGSDDAGFVQVIQGRVNDIDAARRFVDEMEDAGGRDDVLGGYIGVQPDGSFTQVVYFTSEAEARKGEQRATEEGDDVGERMAALMTEPPRFLDLREPWLSSP